MQDWPTARPLAIQDNVTLRNKDLRTHMSQIGVQLLIPVFKQSYIMYALDHAATVICIFILLVYHKTSKFSIDIQC